MSELKIAGYTPPAFKRTTVPDTLLEDSPNLMKKSHTTLLNTVWVSDITYVATIEGWLYLCVIIDLYSRKVVGWSTRKDMKVELLLEAFNKGTLTRRPPGPLIFHSDKGGQYKAKKFRRKLLRHGFRQSTTGKDHCFDSAVAESFFGTLKTELIRRKPFESRASADNAIFDYIEVFYNRTRIHSSLGYQSPEEFERNIA
jgi:putative transposase